MTPFQQKKYWWEWSRCREFYAGKGLTLGQTEIARHDLHRKALGRNKSSKEFSNADLDKVIAAFRAVWDAANLNAQLRQLDQPEHRLQATRQRIAELASQCGVKHGEAGLEAYFANWFRGRRYESLTERELQQLAGILQRRLAQLKPAAPAAVEAPF